MTSQKWVLLLQGISIVRKFESEMQLSTDSWVKWLCENFTIHK